MFRGIKESLGSGEFNNNHAPHLTSYGRLTVGIPLHKKVVFNITEKSNLNSSNMEDYKNGNLISHFVPFLSFFFFLPSMRMAAIVWQNKNYTLLESDII